MGKRGPKSKPQKLRDLDGNPGKQKRQPPAVKATGSIRQPGWVARDEIAAQVWDDAINAMPPGFYTRADNQMLAAYCGACSMMHKAMDDIAEDGITIHNENGKQKNPAVSILEGAQAKIATLGTRLGLDPSARQEIGINAATGDEKPLADGFGDLIAINGGKKSA